MPSLMIPSGLSPFTKQDLVNQFFTPLFIEKSRITDEFTVIVDVKTSKQLLRISPLDKITKGYSPGTNYTPTGNGVVITPRVLSVARMKAEEHQTPYEFYNTVYQLALASGVDMNNLDNDAELKAIFMQAFNDGLARDAVRQGWLGDVAKETMTNTGGLFSPSGTADVHYKEYTGIWPRVIGEFAAGSIPAAQRLNINGAAYQNVVAVAAVKTATLTGASGTANVNINGVNYLATFDTNLTTTAANFVTAHAAAILARHGACVVTSAGADIIVEAGQPGMNVLVSVANVSGALAGSVANTTAAVRNTTLKAGAAKDILQGLYEKRTNELTEFDENDSRFYVTRTVYENYLAYLQTQSGSEAAFSTLVAGVKTLAFNGIPVIKKPDWDKRIGDDFGGVYPHRAMLTCKQAIVFGTDGNDDMANSEAWYNTDQQLNKIRTEYCAGTQIVHEAYITTAY